MSLADELRRAAAVNTTLPPFFAEISDTLTRAAQRIYPVWVVCAPHVADPAHIETRGGTAYLDSEQLLGPADELTAGTVSRRAIQRTFGVLFHEVFHRIGTKRWVGERAAALLADKDPARPAVGRAMMLLEEPRMEAVCLRDYDPASALGRFQRGALNAAVIDVILPIALDQAMQEVLSQGKLSRAVAGHWATYIRARTHYGIVAPGSTPALDALLKQALGSTDLARLDDLYRRVITIAHGDTAALELAAGEYVAIIGPDDTPPSRGGGQGKPGDGQPTSGGARQPGRGNSGGQLGETDGAGEHPSDKQPGSTGGGQGDRKRDGSDAADPDIKQDGEQSPMTAPQAADALKQAVEAVCGTDRQQAGGHEQDDPILDRAVDEVRGDAQGGAAPIGKRTGASAGAGQGRLPDLGINRPPTAEEKRAARTLTHRLRRAMIVGQKTITKRRPGGRFNAKQHLKGHAQRQAGWPVKAEPWTITRDLRTPMREPRILIVVDTSGSMGRYEYALGPITWILTTAFYDLGGRIATVLFGAGAELLGDGTQPMPLVPGIKTGGGTMFGGTCVQIGARLLDLGADPHRPDAIYIVSDGDWYDAADDVRAISEVRDRGVPVVHIGIGRAPMGVQADRVVTITDPADAYDVIARDTLEVLRGKGLAR